MWLLAAVSCHITSSIVRTGIQLKPTVAVQLHLNVSSSATRNTITHYPLRTWSLITEKLRKYSINNLQSTESSVIELVREYGIVTHIKVHLASPQYSREFTIKLFKLLNEILPLKVCNASVFICPSSPRNNQRRLWSVNRISNVVKSNAFASCLVVKRKAADQARYF